MRQHFPAARGERLDVEHNQSSLTPLIPSEIKICYQSRFILVVHILMDKYVHAHVVYVEQWCASAPYMTHYIKYLLLFRVRTFSRAGCAFRFPAVRE